MTPLEALTRISAWKQLIDGKQDAKPGGRTVKSAEDTPSLFDE